jgi:hypothetical protein
VVHIWVRATLDYDDERAFAAQLRPGFREQVALWDALFDMPYRSFRSRVRAIARENLERVEGAVCSSWDDIPEGALVLPADDDDWFAPDIAAVLDRALGPGVTGVRWRSSFLEIPINLRHQLGAWRARISGPARPRPLYLCTTNNYALFASSESEDLLRRHVQASRWVATQPPGAVPFLDEPLSLMNRTLASQTSLGHLGTSISRRRLLGKLPRYRRLYEAPLPPALAWAQPYADQMGALMGELGRRP